MARLLGLLLIVVLVWLGLRSLLGRGRPARPASTGHDQSPVFEKTVRCRHCGVHTPLALTRDDAEGRVCNDPDCRSGRAAPEPRREDES